MIGTRLQDFGGILKAEEILPRLVGSDGAVSHVAERVLGNDSLALSRSEELFRSTGTTADRVVAEFGHHPASPFVSIPGSNIAERFVLAEVFHEVASHLQKAGASSRLDVRAADEIVVDELAEPAVSLFSLRNQSDSRELAGELVIPIGNPLGGVGIERMPGERRCDEVFDFQQHSLRLFLRDVAEPNRLALPVPRDELNPPSAVGVS